MVRNKFPATYILIKKNTKNALRNFLAKAKYCLTLRYGLQVRNESIITEI